MQRETGGAALEREGVARGRKHVCVAADRIGTIATATITKEARIAELDHRNATLMQAFAKTLHVASARDGLDAVERDQLLRMNKVRAGLRRHETCDTPMQPAQRLPSSVPPMSPILSLDLTGPADRAWRTAFDATVDEACDSQNLVQRTNNAPSELLVCIAPSLTATLAAALSQWGGAPPFAVLLLTPPSRSTPRSRHAPRRWASITGSRWPKAPTPRRWQRHWRRAARWRRLDIAQKKVTVRAYTPEKVRSAVATITLPLGRTRVAGERAVASLR